MAMRIKKLEINPRVDEEIYGDSDSESSPSNSPTSHRSSLLDRNDSGVNFTASSSSSSGCFSGSIGDEEDEEDTVDDDNCLDDREAMADALTAGENKQQKHNPSSENGSHSGAKNEYFCDNDICNENEESGGTGICQAWRLGDAFRPQSLANLSLQLNSERQCARKSCPICFED